MNKNIFVLLLPLLIMSGCSNYHEDIHATNPLTFVKSSQPVKGLPGCNRLVILSAEDDKSPYFKEIVYHCENSVSTQVLVGKTTQSITILNNNGEQLFTKEQSNKMCIDKIKTLTNETTQ